MSNYIAHHGIKGQKWGVRRYQNEDGQLTPAGRKNLEKNTDILNRSSKLLSDASRVGSANTKSKTVNKKDYSKLTNEELKARVNRLSLEDQYGKLTGDTKKVRSGMDWFTDIASTLGVFVGIAGGAAGIYAAIKK